MRRISVADGTSADLSGESRVYSKHVSSCTSPAAVYATTAIPDSVALTDMSMGRCSTSALRS